MAPIVRLARKLARERGAELIEMAIVTPILLLIMAGIFDFGMMFRSWEIVTNAAREGARVGTLPTYSAADIRIRVQEYMAVSGLASSCTLQTPGAGSSCTVTFDACTVCVWTDNVPLPSGNAATRGVRVSTRQQLPSLSVIGQFFGGSFSSIDIAANTEMRTEVQAAGP